MKYFFMFLLLAAVMVATQNTDLSGGYDEHMYQRMSDSMDLAADASVNMVTAESVASGDPVFDQTDALSTFKQVLATNMDLNSTTLQPLPGSGYMSAPSIELMKVFDYSNTTAFPVEYKNNTYHINMTIAGPSIVYAIKMPAPQIYGISPAFNMTWDVVAAYPDK